MKKNVSWINGFRRKNTFLGGIFSITTPSFFARRGIYKKLKQNKDVIFGKVLDFGCGQKPYKDLFVCDAYVGIDTENNSNENTDVIYDGGRLPFNDNFFDCVFSTQVFEHVKNLDLSLGEIYRVLKPGGILIFTAPFVWEEHEIPNDFRRFTSYGMKDILELSGFSIEKMEKTTNFIEVVGQLFVSYFARFTPRSIPIKMLFLFLFIAPVNIFFLFLATVLPKNDLLFNDLFCIAKK